MIPNRTLAPLAAALLLIGCGGKSGGGSTSAARAGKATVSIVWPEQARVIPSTANSVIVTLSSASEGYNKEFLLTRPPEGSPTQVSEADFGYLAVASDYIVRARAFAEVATSVADLGSALPIADATAMTPLEIVAGRTTPFTITMQSQLAAVRVTGLNPSSAGDNDFFLDGASAITAFHVSGTAHVPFTPSYDLSRTSVAVTLTPVGTVASSLSASGYSNLNLFVYSSTSQLSTVDLQLTGDLSAAPVSSSGGAVTFNVSLVSLAAETATLKSVYLEGGQAVALKTFSTAVSTKPATANAVFAVTGLPAFIAAHSGEFRVTATLQQDAFPGAPEPTIYAGTYSFATGKVTFPNVPNRGRDFTRTLVYEVKPVGVPSDVYTPLFTVTDRVTTGNLFQTTTASNIDGSAGTLTPFTLTASTLAFSVDRGGTNAAPIDYSPVYNAFFSDSGATFQLPADLFTLTLLTSAPSTETATGAFPTVVNGYKLRLPVSSFKHTTPEVVSLGAKLAGPTPASPSFSTSLTATLAANAGNVTGGVN